MAYIRILWGKSKILDVQGDKNSASHIEAAVLGSDGFPHGFHGFCHALS